ncbi:hypothetical protein LCGC14_0664850 [marine sediment metagenome]|uniref:Uncharacterized protein n=1 Tax=marine sediment metagenome TaxID=412755 RepID=A0A0F9QXS6_9ZZZZ
MGSKNKNGEFLIARIKKYKIKYEVPYKHPELNNMLDSVIKFISLNNKINIMIDDILSLLRI